MNSLQLVNIVTELVEEISESYLQYYLDDVVFEDDYAKLIGEDRFLKVFVNNDNIFEVEMYLNEECVLVTTFNEIQRSNAVLLVAKMFVPEINIVENYSMMIENLPN
jgi:hypothetical protein